MLILLLVTHIIDKVNYITLLFKCINIIIDTFVYRLIIDKCTSML